MSPNDHHHATFSWAAGAQSVNIAGNFNQWSATATPLKKQPDGSFTAQVPLPWGEKQAFKYVVDGEWKVREDEAKEWDAAGNMNNVYTAPPAPISTSPTSSEPSHSNVAAAAPTPAPASSEKTARPTEQDKPSTSHSTSNSPISATTDNGPVRAAVPAKNVNTHAQDTPAPTHTKTEPSTLIASSAPGAASSASSSAPTHSHGSAPGILLGGPVFPTSPKAKSTSPVDKETVIAPPTTTSITTAPTTEVKGETSATSPVVPSPVPAPAPVSASTTAQPEVQAKPATKPLADEPINVQIEKVAKQANIGEAPQPGTEEQGLAERASDFAAGALAAIGAVVGNAAVAVENLTGVDIAHTAPLSVEEAKAQGIDVRTLNKTDAPTDATAPVAVPPPASAVDALQEKVDELKFGSSGRAPVGTSRDTTGISDIPLPKTEPPKTFNAPPGSVTLNHKESEKNPEHDIPAQHETVENHQTVPQPIITTVSDKDPKKDRTSPATTLEDTAGTKPISSNPGVSAKEEKKIAERDPVKTASASDSPLSEPKVSPNAPTSNVGKNQNIDKITPEPQPKPSGLSASPAAQAPTSTPATAPSPATAPPPVHASDAPSTPAKVAPATPAKDIGTPASAFSTPASTPAKSTHTKENTTDSDVKKRKSGFFGKIKNALHKDKSK